jgi:hypothetical protein
VLDREVMPALAREISGRVKSWVSKRLLPLAIPPRAEEGVGGDGDIVRSDQAAVVAVVSGWIKPVGDGVVGIPAIVKALKNLGFQRHHDARNRRGGKCEALAQRLNAWAKA